MALAQPGGGPRSKGLLSAAPSSCPMGAGALSTSPTASRTKARPQCLRLPGTGAWVVRALRQDGPAWLETVWPMIERAITWCLRYQRQVEKSYGRSARRCPR